MQHNSVEAVIARTLGINKAFEWLSQKVQHYCVIARNKSFQYETLKQLSATSGISLFLKNNMGVSNLIWACKFLQEIKGILSKVLLSNLIVLPRKSMGKQSFKTEFGKETVFTVGL